MYNFCYIVLLFIMYSFLGWIVEIIDILVTERKLINRGFLIGPVCPIYGVGILLMIKLLTRFMDTPLALFILSISIFMTLEYLTSYVMEKMFNARWWDYSNNKFNLNGRICLETTIPFGIGGMLVMYVINPFFNKILGLLSHKLIIILGIILLVIFAVDYIVSFFVVGKLRNLDFSKYKDDTDEINKKVREYLINLSPLTRRLMNSFPNLRIKISKIKTKIEKKVAKK